MLQDALAGVGLGLLTGVLVGLSSAPVVGAVVAALAAIIGGFFGVSGKILQANPLRIGCFGIAAVIGLGVGITVREFELASPSVRTEVARWTDAGYPPDDARKLVTFVRYGLRPHDFDAGPRPAPAGSLFSGESSLCGRLQTLPPAEQRNVIAEEAGGANATPALRALSSVLAAANGETTRAVGVLCGN